MPRGRRRLSRRGHGGSHREASQGRIWRASIAFTPLHENPLYSFVPIPAYRNTPPLRLRIRLAFPRCPLPPHHHYALTPAAPAMYEEVCLLCSRPITVDGCVSVLHSPHQTLIRFYCSRAYCSDECESLDATSPSISTTSSAYASPYLHSNNGPGSLADVPALVSSAIGRSLAVSKHKNRHSISSSSTSSAVWSVSTDEDDELASTVPDEDLLSIHGTESTKSADPSLYPFQPRGAGLSYARRPSGTNQRSTVPTLNRHISSTSSVSATGTGSPRSAPPPYSPAEEEFSDVPRTSTSTRSAGRHGLPRRNSNTFASGPSSEQEADYETTISSKRKRNRASLPAYFSLLTTSTSSPTPPRSQRTLSSLQTLTAITRSFQSSPPTPRVAAHPILDPVTAFSHAHTNPWASAGEAPSGRGRKRDPEARSASSRRSTQRSPPRQSGARASRSPPPCAHRRGHIGPEARARLDSIEKVADWVSHSPAMPVRGRTLTRRNSSPAKPKLDALIGEVTEEHDLLAVREVLAKSLHFHTDHDDVYVTSRDRRGRRRPDELDHAPVGVDSHRAPGLGAGRSGLMARERERGRALVRF